jgi:hypothetical protein
VYGGGGGGSKGLKVCIARNRIKKTNETRNTVSKAH